MLVIRKEQRRILDDWTLKRFEDEMVEHLARFSPPLYKVIKEEQMRTAVRFGMQRAGRHELTLRGPIRLYLELMLLFGSHFDTDPQYPWAAAALRERSVSEMQRAEWLYEKTLEYQAAVAGPGGVNTAKALTTLLATGGSPVDFTPDEFDDGMRRRMHDVFPQKVDFVGPEGLSALIREGRDEAKKYGFPFPRGEMLVVVLKFAFGHGCGDDPLYPWIGRTLEDDKIVNPAARAERLEKKALTWLEHVVRGQGERPS